jgi:phospholipase/carboxylesterase
MHQKQVVKIGRDLKHAKKAMIILHGRGATAEDILSLTPHLRVNDFAILAPQATNYTWYPYSFLVPSMENEPWLSSALDLVKGLTEDVAAAGIKPENIYFAGFSQGACLTLEFVTKNAQRWGGVAAFSGGLIGDHISPENYSGDFHNTPVYLGSSNPDPHIPVARVEESAAFLKKMNAAVNLKIYPNMGHTVSMQEIQEANNFVFTH